MTVAERTREIVLRNSRTNPLSWARAHRRMGGGLPYSVYSGRYRLPYLYSVYEAMGSLPPGGRLVAMKSAQTGWSESALNLAFWFLDAKGEAVLYMLPSDRQLSDFSQARVNRAVEASPYISDNCQDVSNVQLKILFGQALYLRGAHSREKLVEIPVGLVVRDEYNLMDPEGAELALSRLGASQYKWVYDLGNPRYPETGIDAAYKAGTREVWEVECPSCNEWREPRWPESVDATHERLVCLNCGGAVDKAVGRWQAQAPGAPYRSFRMSQLVSPTVTPGELLLAWKEAQGDQTRLQLFWNMRMGLPFSPEGARITGEILASLPRLPAMLLGYDKPTVMGVDVGNVLHVCIRKLEGGLIWAGTVDWDRLGQLMAAYQVRRCAIDAMPETTKAKEFARQFPGKVVLVRYLSSASAIAAKRSLEGRVAVLSVPRTEAIDRAYARLLNGQEELASNLPADWFAHVQAMTRQIVHAGAGDYAAWVESGPDHYAHAFTYSELVRDERLRETTMTEMRGM